MFISMDPDSFGIRTRWYMESALSLMMNLTMDIDHDFDNEHREQLALKKKWFDGSESKIHWKIWYKQTKRQTPKEFKWKRLKGTPTVILVDCILMVFCISMFCLFATSKDISNSVICTCIFFLMRATSVLTLASASAKRWLSWSISMAICFLLKIKFGIKMRMEILGTGKIFRCIS